MSSTIQKSFPADTSMEKITFLNDPKVDTELYAYLQSKSVGEDKETRVYKDSLPTRAVIASKILRRKSKTTVDNHLNYLKDSGYIEDKGKYYVIAKSQIYFKIPLDLLQYFIDVVKEDVIKTYIYLGQRFKYKPEGYVFTACEVAEHIGVDYTHKSSSVTNYIDILERLKLIKINRYYDGKKPMMKIIGFSTEIEK